MLNRKLHSPDFLNIMGGRKKFSYFHRCCDIDWHSPITQIIDFKKITFSPNHLNVLSVHMPYEWRLVNHSLCSWSFLIFHFWVKFTLAKMTFFGIVLKWLHSCCLWLKSRMAPQSWNHVESCICALKWSKEKTPFAHWYTNTSEALLLTTSARMFGGCRASQILSITHVIEVFSLGHEVNRGGNHDLKLLH